MIETSRLKNVVIFIQTILSNAMFSLFSFIPVQSSRLSFKELTRILQDF